jgi:hypothetical protein
MTRRRTHRKPTARFNPTPVADELRSITQTLGAAADSIMGCAEAVLGANVADVEAYRRLVEGKMISALESCAFHDLISQRLTKLIARLEQIDAAVTPTSQSPQAHCAHADSERNLRLLLNGPQPESEAKDQAEIDLILKNGA